MKLTIENMVRVFAEEKHLYELVKGVVADLCEKASVPEVSIVYTSHVVDEENPGFDLEWFNERHRNIRMPLSAVVTGEAQDAFIVALSITNLAERVEFERLRLKFCEQPCVDH